MSEKDQFYLGKEEPVKSCLLALRIIILNKNDSITETKKYGMPCFCFQGKAFCYLWTDKKTNEPYLLFVEGKTLNHPSLESGDRKRMKIFRVNSNSDLPRKEIEMILDDALELYRKR
ncbi:DUF1801 domain-containing protein [Algoriphagus sp.]|uniref:DUF1801 domain-containing protein n=1 Tax=Algoriphagus sp. TaxID=1872435 RepID=UPI0025F74383|nr:DUF1801 domain-containing protein [Algoriphagus sp.]